MFLKSTLPFTLKRSQHNLYGCGLPCRSLHSLTKAVTPPPPPRLPCSEHARTHARFSLSQTPPRSYYSTEAHDYSKKLNKLIEQHDYKKAIATLQEMNQKSIVPEHVTYSRILRMYTDQEDVNDVEKTLKQMKEQGIKPDIVTYNAILHMHSRRDDIEAFKKTWNDIKNEGLIKDERSYIEAIRLNCGRGEPEECQNLLREMVEVGLSPTLPIYTDVIYALARKHYYKDALDLYEKVKHRKIKPDAILLNLMLEIGTLIKDPKYMNAILKEMWEHNVEPHPDHYEAIKKLK